MAKPGLASRYTAKQKCNAVQRVHSGETQSAVARAYKVTPATIGKWVKWAAKADDLDAMASTGTYGPANGAPVSDNQFIVDPGKGCADCLDLRAEVARLRTDNAMLRGALGVCLRAEGA